MTDRRAINQYVDKGRQDVLVLVRQYLSGAEGARASLWQKMFLSLRKGGVALDMPYIRQRLVAENHDVLSGLESDDPRLLPVLAEITGRVGQWQDCLIALERVALAAEAAGEEYALNATRDFMAELTRIEPQLVKIRWAQGGVLVADASGAGRAASRGGFGQV